MSLRFCSERCAFNLVVSLAFQFKHHLGFLPFRLFRVVEFGAISLFPYDEVTTQF